MVKTGLRRAPPTRKTTAMMETKAGTTMAAHFVVYRGLNPGQQLIQP